MFSLTCYSHEQSDDDVNTILGHLKTAMLRTPGSRLIINEVFLGSPTIIPSATSPTSTSAPSSDLSPSHYTPQENQSPLADLGNLMTWSTYSLFGGKERSFEEYRILLEKAGFRVERYYSFRTFTGMVEAVVA
jgi:hypothetical protein